MDAEGLVAESQRSASVIDKRAPREFTGAVKSSENGYWNDIQSIGYSRNGGQVPNIQRKDVTKLINNHGDSSLILVPQPDGVQVKRRSGKLSRSVAGCSKRQRVPLEDPSSQTGLDEANDKTQIAKHRNNFISKRSERRNFKAPTKTKFEPFSLKGGLASCSSCIGGSNILGLYGLKSDIHDITKHVDEISLNELLDGSYSYYASNKDKGKIASNGNENILHSINRACSIIQPQRSLQSQHSAETDSSSRILSPGQSSSFSCVASGSVVDERDLSAVDQLSSNKVSVRQTTKSVRAEFGNNRTDSSCKPETPVNILDFPLYQPCEVLDRLALSPAKDLESLLLDAAVKAALSSRNTPDPRSSKSMTQKTCLPPFSWSHSFGGHCRTNSDALKLCTNRSSCQGSRWARIENSASFLGVVSNCFTDTSTLVYDQSLVPTGKFRSGLGNNDAVPSSDLSVPFKEVGSSSQASSSNGSRVCQEPGGNPKHQENVGHSQSVLAAAKTLCEMVTHSSRHNPSGMLRWPKKPLQKAMKAHKLKYEQKSEEINPKPRPAIGAENAVKCFGQIMPSKRPKLSIENKKEFTPVNGVMKGTLAWSAPRACRSSPSRSARDSASESKHHNADFAKHQYMLPPPARVPDKVSGNQHKPRKALPMN